MNDVQFALYEVKLSLDCEIEELAVYGALLPDKREEINAKIEGMKVAQGYLTRKIRATT